MSRLLKLVASVCVLAAGGAVALATGSAPAQTGSHAIICPLEPNDTITYPCCGPPVVTAPASPAFVCCGTPQPINCPVGLTLSSSADPSVAGHKVTLTGRWPGGTAGQTVELFQELPGAKAFGKVAQTKTGSLGEFQFVRKGVMTNRQWYVTAGSDRSLTISQRVKAVVTLTPSLDVHISPRHTCERVLMERASKHGWAVVARPRVDCPSSGGFLGHGTAKFRAVFPGDARNIRSVSNVVVLP